MIFRDIRNRRINVPAVAMLTAALLVIAATFVYVITTRGDKAPKSAPPAPSASATQESPAERQRRFENEAALDTKNAYPWHYKCRTYPADANLKRADLIPTGNVIIVIAFNPATGKYEVQGADPRVTLSPRQDFVNKPTDDIDHPYVTSLFTWTYAKGVRHYGVFRYERETDANGKSLRQPRWYQSGGTNYNPTLSRYQAVTFDDGGAYEPMYMVLATDTRTCAPGAVALPDAFNWEAFAKYGYMRPDPEDPQVLAAQYGPGENPKRAN